MNPIENAWSVLEDRLRARPRMPTTLDDLFAALSEEWDHLPASFFDSLRRSMPTRVEAVVRARGHATKYSSQSASGVSGSHIWGIKEQPRNSPIARKWTQRV